MRPQILSSKPKVRFKIAFISVPRLEFFFTSTASPRANPAAVQRTHQPGNGTRTSSASHGPWANPVTSL